MQPTDDILMINSGHVPLRFFAAAQKTDPIGVAFVEISPMSSQTHQAHELGALSTNHYIKGYNPDLFQEASWELDL